MKFMSRWSRWSLVAAMASMVIAACGKKEAPPPPPPPAPAPVAVAPAPDLVNVPVSVKQVVLANQIGADKKAAAPMTGFAPADTIYAVVESIGSGDASLNVSRMRGHGRVQLLDVLVGCG